MKPKFKGFAFVPLLIVLFLLIISAVTSYVVINQGTGGYKARAGWGIPFDLPDCDLVAGRIPVECGGGDITGSFNPPTKTPTPKPQKCNTVGDFCCRAASGARYCDNSLMCGPTGKCQKKPASPYSACKVAINATCGYVRSSPCPDNYVGCGGAYVCDAEPGAKNGIQVPASGKTGKCVSSDPKPANTDTAPPADTPTDNTPPGGGGGGTSSCAGGVLCDGTPVTGSAGQTVCGQADTTGTCRSWSCNGGSWSYVGDACTVASTVTPVTPPTATGDVTLALSLKLQGVTGNPRGAKTVPFKVKLKGPTSTSDYVTGTLTADSSGKWAGTVNFSGIELGSDVMYSVYVKVGKHLQKRVCVNSPTESPVGTYGCSDNGIVLTSGTNNLDFTNILQLVGDLPQPPAEQNGVVDSYDVSYVLNHFGSTQTDQLNIGDLNFDGVIDTQDRSLIIQSLNVKYDDE